MQAALLIAILGVIGQPLATCPDGVWVQDPEFFGAQLAVAGAADGGVVVVTSQPESKPRRSDGAAGGVHTDSPKTEIENLTVLRVPDGSQPQAVAEVDGGWLVGTEAGAFRVTGDEWYRYPQRPVPPARLLDVRAVLADGETLWFGGTEGLHRLDGETWTHGGGAVGGDWPAVRSVRALLRDPNGVLWVGSSGQGLWARLDDGWYPVGPPVSHITALTWAQGTLWAGTPRGLFKRESFGWTQVEGLPDDQVLALHADRAGALWVSTGVGLGTLAADGYRPCDFGDRRPGRFRDRGASPRATSC